MVDNYQQMLAKRSHVRFVFTNTKKLAKKLARIERSSTCCQQFVNLFADCFCAFHTYQLEFANTSLPTLVCRVKAALVLEGLKWYRTSQFMCSVVQITPTNNFPHVQFSLVPSDSTRYWRSKFGFSRTSRKSYAPDEILSTGTQR